MGLDDAADTLSRWMAHRIAELIHRAEVAPAGEEQEAARHECADLILRVWDRRERWPRARPLAEIEATVAAFLDEREAGMASRSRRAHPHDEEPATSTASAPPTWIELLPALRDLQRREYDLCKDAAVLCMNLDSAAAWLRENEDALDPREASLIRLALRLRERVYSDNYLLDDTSAPGFGHMPAEERRRLLLEAFHRITAERVALLESARFVDKAATDGSGVGVDLGEQGDDVGTGRSDSNHDGEIQ